MLRNDPLHLLAIDLERTSPLVRAALNYRSSEIAALLRSVGSLHPGAELVLVSTPDRLEIYTSGRYRTAVIRMVLKDVVARAHGHARFGSTRVLEAQESEAARHLIRTAAGLLGAGVQAARGARELNVAAALAAQCGTLGNDLASAFIYAARAGRRVFQETAYVRPWSSPARREVDALAVERIVEEELLAWGSWCARHLQAQETSAPNETAQTTRYASMEPGSMIRMKVAKRSVA